MIRRTILLSLVVATSHLSAQDASVTLFNSGRVLVRRSIPVAVSAGSSTKALALGLFDPSSLSSLDTGVSFSSINYDPAYSEESLLRRSIGKTFNVTQTSIVDLGRVTLLGLDPERWKLETSGKVVFSRPGQIQWPADLVPAGPSAIVQVESDKARTSLNVLYQTNGAAWSAQYRLFVGAGARVEGTAQLQSGTLDFANAEVQLLAGDIGAQQGAARPMMMEKAMVSSAAYAAPPTEEAIGESHLYTLPQRVSFVPGTATVVPLFATTLAKAVRGYTVRGALPFYGGLGQSAEEQPVPVEVTWHLDRKLGSVFGDLPLPAGAISVFDTDKSGRTQLIGQGTIGHTAAGEALSVRTGTAFDVTAKRTQTDFTTSRTPAPNSHTVAMIGYQIILQNAKDSAVAVDVLEERGGEWSVVTSSLPPQRRSSSSTAFLVSVPAKGTATLTYHLRVIW